MQKHAKTLVHLGMDPPETAWITQFSPSDQWVVIPQGGPHRMLTHAKPGFSPDVFRSFSRRLCDGNILRAVHPQRIESRSPCGPSTSTRSTRLRAILSSPSAS